MFLPAVDTQGELDAVLTVAADAERLDAVIVRTEEPTIAAAAAYAGGVAMYIGDTDGATAESLVSSGFGMVLVEADLLEQWSGTDLGVWATDVDTAEELAVSSQEGALGALTTDPFALLPDD